MLSILDHVVFSGRRILVVEEDLARASECIAAILAATGLPLGPVSDAGALAFVLCDGILPHAAIIDAHADEASLPDLLALLRTLEIDLIHICGDDGWMWPGCLDEHPRLLLPGLPRDLEGDVDW